MSRLIDADKLKEDIRKVANDIYNVDVMRGAGKVLELINQQPTAFDIDKVVEQLETRRKEYENEADRIDTPFRDMCYLKGVMRGYEYSIDIVKAGELDE